MYLKCNNLNFTYPGSERAVINNLSFHMKSSGFKAVFGPSGVGKTSLAKIIVNQAFKPDSGIITKNINTILYSYNSERLPGWSSTGNHLNKVTPKGKQELKKSLIRSFELNDILDSRFSQLSMGQQNRINLIRYLLQDFDLLILDECLANVDEKLRETIILTIKQLFADKMFLYISHNLMEISKFCSEILVFGKHFENKTCFMVNGQDYKKKYCLDKQKLDITMLEIMSAF